MQGDLIDKKSHILSAARPLFSQFGLKKFTTNDIGKRARISKATIYRYSHNRREIFDEFIALEVHQLLSAIAEAVSDETTAISKLRSYLLSKLGKLRESVILLHAAREACTEHWPQGIELQNQILERQESIVASILEFGNRSGELQADDVGLTAHMLDVIINGIRKR